MLISTDVVCHHLSLYLFVVRCCGPHIYFAGAAWNGDRPNIQVLLPALPFHMHESDTTLRAMAARHLGAYRKAYESLKHYYDEELPSMDPSTFPAERVLFPYPTQFTAVDGTTQAFDYVAQVDPDKHIFFGRLRDGGDEVCIKLARRYSWEVHEFCGLLDIAPRLRGFDKIPGGWYMVVMDQIGEEYTSYDGFRDSSNFDGTARASLLHGAIWKGSKALHRKGFVHGDIRNVNLMVAKNGEAKCRLIDFDWAGKSGTARYPMNVYRGERLWRPHDAYDGNLVTFEHDEQIIEVVLGKASVPN